MCDGEQLGGLEWMNVAGGGEAVRAAIRLLVSHILFNSLRAALQFKPESWWRIHLFAGFVISRICAAVEPFGV